MADYRFYRFDGGSPNVCAELIDAPDDSEAIDQAQQLGRQAVKCELWKGTRLVLTLGSAGLPK